MRMRENASIVAVTLVCALPLQASIEIDTLSLWDGTKNIGGFGEPHASYFGQSFVALDEQITSLSFLLDGTDDVENFEIDTADFHVLITPLAATADRPDFEEVLFESETYSTTLETGYELFTIEMDVAVVPGQSYMWVLDAFVANDGEKGNARLAINYDSYPDGEWRGWLTGDPPNSETRQDHDDYEWFIWQPPQPLGDPIPTVDAAFSMTFVPEPASGFILLLMTISACRRKARGHET